MSKMTHGLCKIIKFFDHILCSCISSCSVLEKDPVGSKVLESYVCVSNSEIKAEKEQPDHEDHILNSTVKFTFSQSSSHSPHWPLISLL